MISRLTTVVCLLLAIILISQKGYSTTNQHPVVFVELGNISNTAHPDASLYYTKHLNLFPFLSPDELKAYLRSIISNPHIKRKGLPDTLVGNCENVSTEGNMTCVEVSTYSYQDARRILFGDIHLGKSELNEAYIEPLYCPNRVTHSSIKPFEVPYGSGLNCEHIWPKSRFGVPKGSANYHIMVSDLHHLYPSVSTVNSRRSSNRFGIPTKIKKVDGCHGTFDGPGDYGSVFMPGQSEEETWQDLYFTLH